MAELNRVDRASPGWLRASVKPARLSSRRKRRLPRPDRDLGLITEIFSGTPGDADLKPDATDP
jgi:hypothetical protein